MNREISTSSPREFLILTLIAANLVFLSWSFGAYPDWALWTSFTLSTFTFVLLLSSFDTFKALLKFPLFWLALAFLAYIFLQASNPAWEIVKDAKGWWLEIIDHNPELPTSVKSPFNEINPFRVLIVMSTAFMMLCGIWLAIKRRKSAIFLLWVFAINGFLYALVATIQKLIGTKKILGLVVKEGDVFFGSFPYRNHGAAYAYIVLSVLMGLCLYYFIKSCKNQRRSGPHILLAMMSIFVATAILLSFSRGAILITSLITICFLGALTKALLKVYSLKTTLLILFSLLVMTGLAAKFVFEDKDYSVLQKRLNETSEGIFSGISNKRRLLLLEATTEMFLDSPIYGHGAGSFRYYFPTYRVHYPLLDREQFGVQAHYLNAHTDPLQFLAEYGIAGCSILLTIFIYFIIAAIYYKKGISSLVFILYIACLSLLLHSSFDFIFQSPSILITAAALFALALKISQINCSRTASKC